MEVKIRTLTPLWTGDINRKGKIPRESGIIGSLRWWYEVLVRGLGGYACDPTDTNSCRLPVSSDKDEKTINVSKLCPACQLFGCSGWSRKFILRLSTDQDKGDKHNGIPIDTEISIMFTELKKITETELYLLNKTLEIIEKYGALGGKITKGYGVIEILKQDILCAKPIKLDLGRKKNNENNYYDLSKFLSYEYVVKRGKRSDRNDQKIFDVNKKIIFSQPYMVHDENETQRFRVFGFPKQNENFYNCHNHIKMSLGKNIINYYQKTGNGIIKEIYQDMEVS